MTINRMPLELAGFQGLDADELKGMVREMLILMNASERIVFIKKLEYEMRRAGLSIRPYLLPLGIAATYAEELTPNEVGHLIRYLLINVPKALSVVVQALASCFVVATTT